MTVDYEASRQQLDRGELGPELTRRYTELASHIRLLAIPFAPVIVARAGGTLIAQTYVSSHPASALLLISPPDPPLTFI